MGLRVILVALGLLHVGFGLYGLAAPAQMAAMVDLEPGTIGALGELRAVYGGLILGLGLVILRGSLGGIPGKAWLRAAAVGYAGLAIGRVASLSVDGLHGYTLLALAFEGLVAALLGWAATQVGLPPTAKAGADAGSAARGHSGIHVGDGPDPGTGVGPVGP